jgi:hypothetical protein
LSRAINAGWPIAAQVYGEFYSLMTRRQCQHALARQRVSDYPVRQRPAGHHNAIGKLERNEVDVIWPRKMNATKFILTLWDVWKQSGAGNRSFRLERSGQRRHELRVSSLPLFTHTVMIPTLVAPFVAEALATDRSRSASTFGAWSKTLSSSKLVSKFKPRRPTCRRI